MFFNLAKLNFYGGNYKFNITFASLKSTDNESNLDNTTSDNIKCIHDICLVRSPEASGNEDILKLAANCRDTIFLGSSLP